jgi:hypothetical protein
MSKIYVLYLTEEQLLNYIKYYGPKKKVEFLPYPCDEITCAIWSMRILENNFGTMFALAIEVPKPVVEIIHNFNPDDTEQIHLLFNKLIAQNSEIDFSLAIITPNDTINPNKLGYAFQVKVFSSELINFEQKLSNKINYYLHVKYPRLSRPCSLILMPQLKSGIYIERELNHDLISRLIKPNRESFEKVLLLTRWEKKTSLIELLPGKKELYVLDK